LYHYECKYGIRIAVTTKIGPGLYIGNYSGIFVNTDTVIGKNFNISQGVVIGGANRGPRKGTAVIGDNVYIGPGAKIVGKVQIGNNVAIGANCVVTKDIPDNAVVVGVPGKAIKFSGSGDYVHNTDY
jgi:serine O-acetyltransferase